jgi:hypothetical protein
MEAPFFANPCSRELIFAKEAINGMLAYSKE